jgi:hypothetical protein
MMFSSNTCRFLVSVLSLSLLATAETVRGVHRELGPDEFTDAVDLGTAGNYAILSKTGISTVPESVITGDIAVSPIAGGAITGFSLIANPEGIYTKAGQVNGKVYAANYLGDTPSVLTTAVGDMEIAYTDAASRANTKVVDLHSGLIGGKTLTEGVYKYNSDVEIYANTDVTFDGNADSVFIIRMTGSLLQAANTNVILLNGVKAENIFWQVAGAVSVGAGATMKGTLLVKTSVTFMTGSTLIGRVLAQTACVLQSATITP